MFLLMYYKSNFLYSDVEFLLSLGTTFTISLIFYASTKLTQSTTHSTLLCLSSHARFHNHNHKDNKQSTFNSQSILKTNPPPSLSPPWLLSASSGLRVLCLLNSSKCWSLEESLELAPCESETSLSEANRLERLGAYLSSSSLISRMWISGSSAWGGRKFLTLTTYSWRGLTCGTTRQQCQEGKKGMELSWKVTEREESVRSEVSSDQELHACVDGERWCSKQRWEWRIKESEMRHVKK